ncbi:MAG: cell division protein ZapA [Alphaproteobacteria bacterium]
MAQVDVTINDQNYRIACEEGQQDHLRRLAGGVDKRIAELVAVMGQIGELRLLVMASMLMADEISELRDNETAAAEASAAETSTNQAGMDAAQEASLVNSIESLAQRIESVAARIEHA